jgi:hypothetical protein
LIKKRMELEKKEIFWKKCSIMNIVICLPEELPKLLK